MSPSIEDLFTAIHSSSCYPATPASLPSNHTSSCTSVSSSRTRSESQLSFGEPPPSPGYLATSSSPGYLATSTSPTKPTAPRRRKSLAKVFGKSKRNPKWDNTRVGLVLTFTQITDDFDKIKHDFNLAFLFKSQLYIISSNDWICLIKSSDLSQIFSQKAPDLDDYKMSFSYV